MNNVRALGIILATVLLLFLHTTKYRTPFLAPTYLQNQVDHQTGMAFAIINLNAWLQDNAFPERRYDTESIDTTPVNGHGYQVGALIPAYLLIKFLSLSNPDITHDRGLQIFTLYSLGIFMHLITVLMACLLAYLLFRRVGYSHLNAAIIGLVPAFVLIYSPAFTCFLQINYSAQAFVLPLLLAFLILELAPQSKAFVSRKWLSLCMVVSATIYLYSC